MKPPRDTLLTTSGFSSGALPLSLMPVLRSRLPVLLREAHAGGHRERVRDVPVHLAEGREALVLDVLHAGRRIERHQQAIERVLQQVRGRRRSASSRLYCACAREPGAGVVAPVAAIVRHVVHLDVVETRSGSRRSSPSVAVDAQLLGPLLVVVPEAAGIAIHVERRAVVVDRLEVIVLVGGDRRESEARRRSSRAAATAPLLPVTSGRALSLFTSLSPPP